MKLRALLAIAVAAVVLSATACNSGRPHPGWDADHDNPAGDGDAFGESDGYAGGDGDGDATGDAGGNTSGDGGGDDAGFLGPPPSILPVSYSRPDVGTPLSPAELAAATDELIALLRDTHYFDFVDERIHGWPETDPANGFWYGHFWSGITVTKTGGVVTYHHSNDGADNVGLHTAPYLEGACYGHLMWGEPQTAGLVRRIVRAYSAWSLAMVRSTGDTNPTLLARSFYRPNVASSDGGRELYIDYGASYPGIDTDASEYVHLPANPTFGDIYIKNKRSKDDIGHMLRSLVQANACAPRLDAPGQADIAQTTAFYAAWARRVDAQGFAIETLDKQGNLWTPPDLLAHYSLTANAECLGALAVRLLGSGAPGDLDCGDGVTTAEGIAWPYLKNDARQILRTNHAAAVALAYQTGQLHPARLLLEGLAKRLEMDMVVVELASLPEGFVVIDVASEIALAANVGVPLTSREVRFLHAKLHEAYLAMRAPAHLSTFALFAPETSDGTYSYDPPNAGMFFRDLGMLLGTCASRWRNPQGRPLLDCDRLLAAF